MSLVWHFFTVNKTKIRLYLPGHYFICNQNSNTCLTVIATDTAKKPHPYFSGCRSAGCYRRNVIFVFLSIKLRTFEKKIVKRIKDKKTFTVLAHIAGWLGYFFIPAIINDIQNKPDIFRESGLWWGIQILILVLFYSNYLVLIPKLLFKKKYLIYAVSIIIFIAGFSLLIEFFNHDSGQMHHEVKSMSELPPPKPPGDFDGMFRGFPVFTIVFIISTALRMSIEWFKNERQRKELENDKLKAELEVLRAQIDPHFFFNVLNNICSLARKKSDDTESFIIRLSELLRYNLYENKGEKFLLEKEINFLNNYIEIQRMRLDKNADIVFDYMDTNQNLLIEPMLLYPFVENAFKHGISYQNVSHIEIKTRTEQNKLFFSIENPFTTNTTKEKNSGGIGLVNVEKRLELLYPDKHKLEVCKENNKFCVTLIIEL